MVPLITRYPPSSLLPSAGGRLQVSELSREPRWEDPAP